MCTLREAGAGACGHAEAGGGDSEGADVLLRLEQDDVDLRSEQAAQDHRAAQADGDAHGGGLNLGGEGGATRSAAGPHTADSRSVFVGEGSYRFSSCFIPGQQDASVCV